MINCVSQSVTSVSFLFSHTSYRLHLKVVGQDQVTGQISGMEGSVDSVIKKPFCSRNYDKKSEITKAKKLTPKIDKLSSKLGCLKKCLMLVRLIALNFRALPHICFI